MNWKHPVSVATLALLAAPLFGSSAFAASSGGDVQINNISMGVTLEDGRNYKLSDDGTLRDTEGNALQDSGDIEFTEVEVVGPFRSSQSDALETLNTWVDSRTHGPSRAQPTFGFGAFSLHRMTPVSYQPPAVRAGDDSLLEERFSFKPERVEGATGPSNGANPGDNAGKKRRKTKTGGYHRPGRAKYGDITLKKGYIASKPGSDTEEVLTGRNFRFEIDGKALPVTAVQPGAFRAELKDATMGNRQTNHKTFTVTKPSFDTWRIEKAYNPKTGPSLKELFMKFATGKNDGKTPDTGSLVYFDGKGNDVRRIDFSGFVPVHYEVIRLDKRNPGQAATEVMEFSVARCAYY